MGLYLAVFDGNGDEVDGVEVGGYGDFGFFRDTVTEKLAGGAGRFPTLLQHSDCEGEWTPKQAEMLERELPEIGAAFRKMPPIPLASGWKETVAKQLGLDLRTLYDCFFDIDGEPLIERLTELARLSHNKGLAILFQ